jgi:hypothetical protein
MVFWTVITTAGLCALGLAGYVRPGAEVGCLRDSIQAALPHLENRICVNIGGFTFGAVRAATSLFDDIPAEPRAAIRAVRGVNVAVYGPGDTLSDASIGEIVRRADVAMKKKHWERAVLVREKAQTVAVYVPANLRSTSNLRACVMVLEQQQIVLVSAKANLDPLLALAKFNPALTEPGWHPIRRIAGDPK